MNVRFIMWFVAVTGVFATSIRGETHFERDPVFFYQPDAPLQARLASGGDLAAYIKRLQAIGTAFFVSEKAPEILDVVVGVKPGKKVKIWLISSRRSREDKNLAGLRKKLEAVPACAVRQGPVAFALRWRIPSDAFHLSQRELFQRPIPKEWRDAAGGHDVSVPDGIFARIWPD
jgi:hypothetical protein